MEQENKTESREKDSERKAEESILEQIGNLVETSPIQNWERDSWNSPCCSRYKANTSFGYTESKNRWEIGIVGTRYNPDDPIENIHCSADLRLLLEEEGKFLPDYGRSFHFEDEEYIKQTQKYFDRLRTKYKERPQDKIEDKPKVVDNATKRCEDRITEMIEKGLKARESVQKELRSFYSDLCRQFPIVELRRASVDETAKVPFVVRRGDPVLLELIPETALIRGDFSIPYVEAEKGKSRWPGGCFTDKYFMGRTRSCSYDAQDTLDFLYNDTTSTILPLNIAEKLFKVGTIDPRIIFRRRKLKQPSSIVGFISDFYFTGLDCTDPLGRGQAIVDSYRVFDEGADRISEQNPDRRRQAMNELTWFMKFPYKGSVSLSMAQSGPSPRTIVTAEAIKGFRFLK